MQNLVEQLCRMIPRRVATICSVSVWVPKALQYLEFALHTEQLDAELVHESI